MTSQRRTPIARLHGAVLLSGFGGILVELVLVRRFGLLIGNTTVASAFVIGAYLLGLGIGGLLVGRVQARVTRPLLAAAVAYSLVALTAFASDAWLAAMAPPPFGVGIAMLALTPGIPTLLMGIAFPLLFSEVGEGSRRLEIGALNAANLAGSLLAVAVADNVWVPAIGVGATLQIGCLAYLGAAGFAAWAARDGIRKPATPTLVPAPALGQLAWIAATGGALVVGLQVHLLRRLPFVLEGFQPTLSGVLAACLVGLALGSAIGTPLLARWLGPYAAAGSVLLAALTVALGLPEHLAHPVAQAWLPIDSTFVLHARIWSAAGICAIPACFFLGATVPLCVANFKDASLRGAAAGRLFFWQGVGSIVGSLVLSQALPRLAPQGFFVWAPVALGLLPLVVLGRHVPLAWSATQFAVVVAAAAFGWSGIGTLMSPDPPLHRPGMHMGPQYEALGHQTDSGVTASVVYDPVEHRLILYTNEFAAATRGPRGDYMKSLGHLPFLLRDDLDHVAIIAFGTGTTAASVTQWAAPSQIDLVEISSAVIGVSGYFGPDGPLREPVTPAFLHDPRARVHLQDGRRYLAEVEAGSLDLVTMEPLLAYSPGTTALYTREFYALAARALNDEGLLVQWIPTHALPPDYYDALLHTFAAGFAHHSVWFLDGATLLVGSATPHLPSQIDFDRRIAGAGEVAVRALHEARLADWTDLEVFFVGEDLTALVGDAPIVSDDRPFTEHLGIWKYDGTARGFAVENFRVLERLAALTPTGALGKPTANKARRLRVEAYRLASEPAGDRSAIRKANETLALLDRARRISPQSVLLHFEETEARRAWLRARADATGGRGLTREATALAERDPSAALPIILSGLAGVRDVRDAARIADALQPGWGRNSSPWQQNVRAHSRGLGPLPGILALPKGEALIDAATGDDDMAWAVRGAYTVRVARALLDVLAERPLTETESSTLRQVLDPASFRAAQQRVRERGGDLAAEIEILRRPDLDPTPAS